MNYEECYAYLKTLDKEQIKKLGVIYTPLEIVEYINEKVLNIWKENNVDPPRIIDFSCGTGVFLINIVEKISEYWNISKKEAMGYVSGCDLDEDAIGVAKSQLPHSNLFVANGLDVNLTNYDIVVGNPPYVKIQNLPLETRKKIESLEWACGDYDLYIAFFERALKECAIVGFITPNSWVNTKSAKHMREWLKKEQTINEIVNFKNKKVFNGYDAYCAIAIVGKKKKGYFLKNSLEDYGEKILYSDFDKEQFMISNKDLKFLKEVDLRKVYLFDICDIKTGLATLADNIFVLEDCTVKGNYILFKKNNLQYCIEKEITLPCKRSGKIKRLLNKNHDRVLFPYCQDKANLLKEDILQKKYPRAYAYLKKHKNFLLERDSGKIKENEWYSFGRTQGLKNNTEKLLLPALLKEPFVSKDDDSYFIGYAVFSKTSGMKDLERLHRIFMSQDIMKWVKIYGSPRSSSWYGIKKNIFKKYKIKNFTGG